MKFSDRDLARRYEVRGKYATTDNRRTFSMGKIIWYSLALIALLGMGYGALVLLGRLAVLIDTNDWVSGAVGIVLALVCVVVFTSRK